MFPFHAMKTRRLAPSTLSSLTVLGSLAISNAALAQAETHDGFYFNGQIGFGGSTIVIEDEGLPDVEFENGNGDFSLDLGGALSPSVVIFARFWNIYQASPNAESGGVDIDLADDVSVFMRGAGLGARYYFMPINLYVGATLGVTEFGIEADGDALAESDVGFAVQLEVGKEWWVSADWAIGVGGRFTHGAADDEPQPGSEAGHVTGDALGVLFSATYN